MKVLVTALMFSMLATSCGGFKAKRVDAAESDERALSITDNWVNQDTTQVVAEVIKQMRLHPGFGRMKARHGVPKLFIAEVQNDTAEAYFPIGDLNDELLNELSLSGDFELVDNKARESLLKEITYQNDGMVDPKTAKKIGNQIGADILIFGNVYMKPEKRDGKTIKEYSVNLRMTDLERGTEVLRTRAKVFKYSEKSKFGW